MHANHSSSAMDMSVLERQRSLVQRLYQQQQQLQHCPQIMVNENPMLLPPKMNDHSYFNGNLQNFPMYGASQFGFPSSPDLLKTCFETDSVSTISPKKRKAESEVKEECNDKGIEGEAARESQSGISVKSENENSKVSEVNKKSDYIHVRARRGQATDNHSLAERARREKISKKMRCLQELVPGCNKVTGKACMLDEIIYYVQSLQKQVEFLSMKLGDVNPRLDLNVDNLFAKELPAAYITSFPTPLDTANSNYFQLQQGGMSSYSIDTLTNGAQMMIPQRRDTSSSSISTPELHLVSSFIHQVHQQPQLPSWESDWQNLYNVNFH